MGMEPQLKVSSDILEIKPTIPGLQKEMGSQHHSGSFNYMNGIKRNQELIRPNKNMCGSGYTLKKIRVGR